MKKEIVCMPVLALVLGIMVLAACATSGGATHGGAVHDQLAGKAWRSGPNDMNMWNVWDFKTDGTFNFIHYHSAENLDPRGVHHYQLQDNTLRVKAPDGKETSYTIHIEGTTFTLSPAAGGGNNTYTVLEGYVAPEGISAHRGEEHSEGVEEITTPYAQLWSSDTITVKAGVPVRWYVEAAPGSLPMKGMACGKTIKIPGLGWGTDSYNDAEGHLTLVEGKNLVYEFTPSEVGDILFTCWMGSECHSNYIHVTADGVHVSEARQARRGGEALAAAFRYH
jgi:hypothetical protein